MEIAIVCLAGTVFLLAWGLVMMHGTLRANAREYQNECSRHGEALQKLERIDEILEDD